MSASSAERSTDPEADAPQINNSLVSTIAFPYDGSSQTEASQRTEPQTLSSPASRRVSWSTEEKLRWVETRDELLEHKQDMWYDRDNVLEFRKEAIQELMDHMKAHKLHTMEDAFASLYHGKE